jgi:hypothetical protein
MNQNTLSKSILPNSLQQDITKKTPRDVLKEKLRERINAEKNNREKPSQQMKQKLEKDAKKEKKEVDNDPRVTPKMKILFVQALQTYKGLDLENPCDILNNADEYKLKYYNFSIKLLKDNNNNSKVLDNPYCNYMKEVLGL